MFLMIYFILTPIIIFILILVALHIGFIPPRLKERKTPLDWCMAFSELKIPTRKNKHLFAWFISAKKKYSYEVEKSAENTSVRSSPLVIIVHGWGGNTELMLPVAAVLYQAGINVLLFDARCHGKSDADTYAALPRFAEDLNSVVDYTRQSLAFNGDIILLGHSVGAGAALLAASKRDDISAVISLAAFSSPEQVMRRYFEKFKTPEILTRLLLLYVQWVIGHKFEAIAPLNTIKKIKVPVLLVHGSNDRTIPVENALAIHKQNPDSQLIIIDGAGHRLINRLKSHGKFLIDFIKKSEDS